MTQPNQPIENLSPRPEQITPRVESPKPEQQFEVREKEPTKLEVKGEGFLEEAIGGLKNKLRGGKKKPTTIPQVRDALVVEVEKVMEEGLKEAWKELGPIQRQEFKIKGEQTAVQIRELLKAAHVKVKKIFRLIVEWLKMLPGINRFFLEQEAKIKTDKILALKRVNDNK